MAFEPAGYLGAPLGESGVSDRPSPRETLSLLVGAARSEDLGFLAAAIAYYAFVSTIPLAILGLALASVLGGDALADALAGTLAGALSPEVEPLLRTALETTAGRGSATLVGLLVLLWSGLRLFRGLNTAFARIYGTNQTTTFLGELRDAVATLGGIAVAVGLLAGILVVLGSVSVAGGLLAPLAGVLALPVAFFPIYYILPDVDIRVREAIPGAILAGLGWTILGWVFAVYAALASTASVYGAIGTVLLALTWFYAGALLVLLGALLNVVRAGRLDNRQLQQVAGPVDG